MEIASPELKKKKITEETRAYRAVLRELQLGKDLIIAPKTNLNNIKDLAKIKT
jgi:hypothetical protein